MPGVMNLMHCKSFDETLAGRPVSSRPAFSWRIKKSHLLQQARQFAGAEGRTP